MIRKLILMRHGIAFEKDADQTDAERELDPRGIPSIVETAKKINELAGVPQVIISSDALRAKQTAMYVAETIGYNPDRTHINDELYQASARIFFQTINQLKDDWEKVLIIGHNPTISYIAEFLSSAEIGSMTEASAVSIEFKIASWSNITQGSGKLEQFFTN
ncbi:MAG TPA: histidine phosphatase family protein [Cyclobacteriaceae bacterium]|nr:histidine phosphatase family protein [Cyclobacteriaceae bacterium]